MIEKAAPEPGACGDPDCHVLHADPSNPIHPPWYTPSASAAPACGHRIVLKGCDLVIACTTTHGDKRPGFYIHSADVQIAGGGTASVEWDGDEE